MTKIQALVSLAVLSFLSACGPAGKISGKVVVEGGSAGKILVRVLGPTSVGVLTDDSGNFNAEKLADGAYQVIAEVPNTDVDTQRDAVNVANGTADKSPTLSFKASVGKISGKVLFNDMTDSSGLTVTLSGTDNRGAQTDSAGAFSFDGLKAGAYLVSAEVPGSREQRQSVSVMVGGAVTVPDMTFTLLGTLTGNVKAGTANAPNAVVNVPGTELFTLTDPNGDFTLRDVPAGMHSVMARLNSATAVQQVTVAKGSNTPLAFTLQTSITGTVEGSIGFIGSTIDTTITVSAAGTTYTATAAANGDFRLTLPPGVWEIVADARNYPRKSMGTVLVSPGATSRLPTAKMSVYRRLAFDLPLTGAGWGARQACEGDIVLADVSYTSANDQLQLIDTNLLNRRVVALGANSTLQVMSSKCKWAAWQFGTTYVVLHNVTTGEQRFLTGSATYIDFSTDETVLFYLLGSTLHRYNIASSVDDSFTATQFQVMNRDRYLVSGNAAAPFTYQLVTPTASTASFTNASLVQVYANAAWALTECAGVGPVNCNLRTLGTSGSTINQYLTGTVVSTTALDTPYSTGEYYLMRTSATASILVRTSTAVGVNMPTSTQWIRYNPSGTRMVYAAPAAAQSLREEALPGTGTVSPQATTTTSFAVPTYISDARVMVFDNATPRRIDIKSGTAAIDADVTTPANGGFATSGSVTSWGKASTSKRIAVLGDGADQVIDVVPTNFTNLGSVLFQGVNTNATFTVPKYGAVSTDPNTTFVIDANKNELRKLNSTQMLSGQSANTFYVTRNPSGEIGHLIPGANDQFLQVNEPGVSPVAVGLQPMNAYTWFVIDPQTPKDLMVLRITQQP